MGILLIHWWICFDEGGWCYIACCCDEFGWHLMVGGGCYACDCVLLWVGYFGGDSVGSVRGVRL